MLAPPPRIWQGPPPPAHVNGAAAATRYGYSSLAQILPSPQDKGDEEQQAGVFPEEPVKLRRETKTGSTDWRRKDRNRIKAEPGTTPCQVQEVTTSSKHDHNGSSIPVGIAVARQRVQQTTPPPLTVLTCEERSTNQVTGWSGPPPHWQYPGVEQSLGVQMPPLQLSRDPISGQLLILPSGNLESMQRAVLWPGGSGTGGNSQPPPLVMPGPQPVLLSDRYVTLAPPPSAAPSSAHHHQEKRRAHDHSTTTIHGSSSGGLAVGLFPPPPPPQAPFLMMPFSHQNNSLLLSTHLTEHNLNTMVVTNHQLSESAAVLNPMEVITSPVDGFGGGGMIQQLPPSVVISHTETNSFVRSDINAVYPSQAQVHSQTSQPPAPPPPLQQERIVVKEEVDHNEETIEDEPIEEEVKTEVMDASNQTESPVEDSEGEEEVMVKVEEKGCITVEEPLPEPDMSGLELLINSIAQIEKKTSSHEETFKPSSPEISHSCEVKMQEDEWKDGNVEDSIKSGLGLLCSVAERCLEEEVVDQEKVELKDFPSPASPPLTDENDQKIDNQLSEDPLSDVSDCEKSSRKEIREKASPEKKGEWYASADLGRDRLKIKIKRRPGRPKKKIKIRKHRSPTRCEPPVLQPWSASIDGTVSPLTSPPTLTPHKRKLSLELSQESDEGSSSSGSHPPPLSPACPSSAKKRKVGRPKKRGDETPPKTELIVTKSVPSSKAIGRILANKSGGTSNQTSSHSPPPQTSVGSHNKIKPKLKAEVKVKQWHDDEDLELSPGKENGLDVPLPSRSPVWKSPTSLKVSALSPGRTLLKTEKEEEQVSPSSSLPVQSNKKHERSLSKIPDCKLTEQHLKSLPWSILSETNGQFFPGKVTKIVAPDIYEVQYQQERWRKPHILCREEILTSSVTEMNIPEDLFVPAGTRVCAYWSHLSCYYPGRVICDSPSGQVLIDFDDGDTGTIERARLRFLPHDYPLVEPPVHRGKRKRYSSTTSSDSLKNNDSIETAAEPENTSTSLSDAYDKAENIKSEVTENVKEENSQDEAEKNSVIDGEGANEIMSVLEHFFQSEALGMERKSRHTDKSHRHHKHHKHRGGCKTHKCKHKHFRSRKHKHSPGEAKRRELDHSTSIDKSNEHLVTPGLTISTDKNASQKGNEESAGTRRATPLANNTKPKTGGFPPAKQEMWSWVGSGTKRGRPLGPRGKGLRICYKAIHRGKEVISVGDCAVFKSIGRRDRPYIGRITSFWQYQMKRNMMVRVSWFYHPEEAIGCPDKLPYPGGVFESAHVDINDVQTITHQCQVLTYLQFHEKAKADPDFVDKVYETHKTFYLAGRYVPAATKLILDPEVEAVCGIQPSEGSTETTKSQEH